MYLNCHTCFSLKYGVMPVKALLAEAQVNGVKALALTDINNTSACPDFARIAPRYGIKPIVGIEFRNGAALQYIGIARNNDGYRELNEHLTNHLVTEKDFSEKAPPFENAFVIYPFGRKHVDNLRENEFIGVHPSNLTLLRISRFRQYGQKLVAHFPVTFRNKTDFNTHRLLRTIDLNTLLSKLPRNEQGMENEIMLPEKELCALYKDFPEIMENTRNLLEQSHIDFQFGKSKNKKVFFAHEAEDREQLRTLAEQGLAYRYDNPSPKIRERLEMELKTIYDLGFTSYFLINWDIVRYAERKGYFYVGRGSGANSLVAYCLKITDVDPVELDLYFERFINPSRKNPPDFDIDFSWKDRDDVTRYIFEKHGEKNTALLATYSTFQRKAAIRELGKVFGLPDYEIEKLEAVIAKGNYNLKNFDYYQRLIHDYSQQIHGLPSHLSIHAGGVLISEKPMANYTALHLPPKGFLTTQFSMLEAEDIGLYKFDILSQRGLGHIKDAISIIRQNRGEEVDIHDIPKFKRDKLVKKLLRTGQTIGCFYIESPAMRQLLKKLEVEHYLGLVAASSIIRPGVAKSGMMREYVMRFRDPERRKQANPKLWEIMPDTFGVMVYQEDVIKVAHYYAGLTLEESDVMRRGMSGKFRSREEFQRVKRQFFINCKQKGYPDDEVKEIWRQIESFAGYSFAKGHSASYAVESYQSLYLKAHYPLEFMVGVINNFGGFYGTEYYLHEAKMHGAKIELPCINKSGHLTNIEGATIYMGFIHIKELEQRTVENLLAARQKGKFKSLQDFVKRVPVSLIQLRILIRAGAFRFIGLGKKELYWEAHVLLGESKRSVPKLELFDTKPQIFQLPRLEYDNMEAFLDELQCFGFPHRSPFDLLSTTFRGDVLAKDLMKHIGQTVRMVGYYVNIKNVKTVTGQLMNFGCFFDADGAFFDTVHFPQSIRRYPFTGKGCYLMRGKVTEEFGVAGLEVDRMAKLGWG